MLKEEMPLNKWKSRFYRRSRVKKIPEKSPKASEY